MNKIVIGSYEFTDETILENPQKFISNSMLADSLEIDTLEFTVYTTASGTYYIITANGEYYSTSADEPYVAEEGYFINTPYATPVMLYKNNTLRGKFFLKSIQRVGMTSYKVQCVSAIGLLDGARTVGGIYTGETAGNIITALMADAGFSDYTIDPMVAVCNCYGWIPSGSVRDALNQILFAFGASVLKNADGSLYFYFIGDGNPQVIADNAVYIGGSVDNPATVTDVNLYEHFFTQASDNVEEVLFDNNNTATANNLVMYFDEPMHSLRVTGTLVINSSGANYATVTGIGQLYGKKYTHTKRLLTQHIRGGEKNEVTIEQATLISAANSTNCLKRLENYYTNAQSVNMSLIDNNGFKAGDYIQVSNPFEETVTGFIQEIDETYSATDKANVKLITNWTPSNLGNTYDSFLILTDADLNSGTWTVPVAMRGKQVTIAMFSGASGGQGGEAGGTPSLILRGRDGGTVLYDRYNSYGFLLNYDEVGGITIQSGGAGGKGGKGGASASRMLTFETTLGNSHQITFGQGGAGGTGGTVTRDVALDVTVTPPTLGSEGGDSSFDTFTTLDGVSFRGTYVNLINGQVLAEQGQDGVDGGDGGNGGTSMQTANATVAGAWATTGKGAKGQNINGHTGGNGGNGYGSLQYPRDTSIYVALCGGGGGGGASYDANGSAGSVGTASGHNFTEYTEEQGSVGVRYYATGSCYVYSDQHGDITSRVFSGSQGGNGASATTVPSQVLYKGGYGGHGGGGGGGGSVVGSYARYNYQADVDLYYGATLGGLGGNGSDGGQGSNGFLIIYYQA